jgi:DNA-binding MarR family transcriptional regulator
MPGPQAGPEHDEYAAIGRELGQFMRRMTRVQSKRADPDGPALDRAAFQLLHRLVADGPARLSTLATDMVVDLSVVSRQIATLEAAGLVVRTSDPADRRASLIAASDAGTDLFNRKRARFQQWLRTMLADWTERERTEFARLMARFNEAMAAHDEGK